MADLYALALQHYHAGRATDAETALQTLLQHDPGHIQALNLLGVIAFRGGRFPVAAAAFAAILQQKPGFEEILANLGMARMSMEQPDGAAACFRRLTILQPASPVAFNQLGTALQHGGDLDAAVAHLRRAARLEPDKATAHGNLGLARMSAGMIDAAASGFRQTLALTPSDAAGYAILGGLLLNCGALDAAAAAFARADRLAPGNMDAQRGLIRCGRYQAAIRAAAAPQAAGRPGGSPSGSPGGLVVRGHFAGVSGYAHMTDRFVRHFFARNLPIDLIGLFGPESWENSPPSPPVAARAAVNFLVPAGLERMPGLSSILFSMFEGTRIPPAWTRLCSRADLVIVPTESSRLAWIAGGYPEDRLRVCPLGVDPAPEPGPVPLLTTPNGRAATDYRWRFLNVSDFIPRKNVDGLLRVWLQATRADDDAVLILKLGKGSPRTSAILTDLVQRTEAAVGRRLADAAPVAVVNQTLDETAMTGLFRVATHYWSLSHGEGWDLPMSKAGAMGLRLIAPRHSSYVDYLDDTVAHMIPSAPGPAHLPYSAAPWPPFHGLDWWEPDETAAAAIIRRILDGRDDAVFDARSRLVEHFSWDQATSRLLETLHADGML